MTAIIREVSFKKKSLNKLNKEKLEAQLSTIAKACENRPSAAGVVGTYEIDDTVNGVVKDGEKGYNYRATIKLIKRNYRSADAAEKHISAGIKLIEKMAVKFQWTSEGTEAEVEAKEVLQGDRSAFKVGHLTDEVKAKFFHDVYERESHLNLLHDAVENAIATNFAERSHAILYGPPAACKTMLLLKMKEWYETEIGDGNERVGVINSTTASKAGLELYIKDKAKDGILPEIIVLDEIEKLNLDNLLSFLQILDEQGTVSRLNARTGQDTAVAKPLVFATCNDANKVRQYADGALWSRFPLKVPCRRPSKDLMHAILLKKIEGRKKLGVFADSKMADKIIEFAFETVSNKNIPLDGTDPRFCIAMLSGGKRILDGTYFQDILKIHKDFETPVETYGL